MSLFSECANIMVSVRASFPFVVLAALTFIQQSHAHREPIYKCISNRELADIPFQPDHIAKFEKMLDLNKQVIVHKNSDKMLCFLQKTWIDTNTPKPKTKSMCLTDSQLLKFGGVKVYNFCKGYKPLLVGSMTSEESNNETQDSYELFENVLKHHSARSKRNTGQTPSAPGQYNAPLRGRYRGQTQSQYLNFNGDSTPPGRAEAESTPTGSRAVVSGKSGMGQAQSQSGFSSGCEDCYDQSQIVREPYTTGKIKSPHVGGGGPGFYSETGVVGPRVDGGYPTETGYTDDRSKPFSGYPPAGGRQATGKYPGGKDTGRTEYPGSQTVTGQYPPHHGEQEIQPGKYSQQPGSRIIPGQPGYTDQNKYYPGSKQTETGIPEQRPYSTHVGSGGRIPGYLPDDSTGYREPIPKPEWRPTYPGPSLSPGSGGLQQSYDKTLYPGGTKVSGQYPDSGSTTSQHVQGPIGGDSNIYRGTGIQHGEGQGKHVEGIQPGQYTLPGSEDFYRGVPGSYQGAVMGKYPVRPGTYEETGIHPGIPGTYQVQVPGVPGRQGPYYKTPGSYQETPGTYPSSPRSYDVIRTPGRYQIPHDTRPVSITDSGLYQGGVQQVAGGRQDGQEGKQFVSGPPVTSQGGDKQGTTQQQGQPDYYQRIPGTYTPGPDQRVQGPGTYQSIPISYQGVQGPQGTYQRLPETQMPYGAMPGSYQRTPGTEHILPPNYDAPGRQLPSSPKNILVDRPYESHVPINQRGQGIVPEIYQGIPSSHQTIPSESYQRGTTGGQRIQPPYPTAPGTYQIPGGIHDTPKEREYPRPGTPHGGITDSYQGPPGTQRLQETVHIKPGTYQGPPGTYPPGPHQQLGPLPEQGRVYQEIPGLYPPPPGTYQGIPRTNKEEGQRLGTTGTTLVGPQGGHSRPRTQDIYQGIPETYPGIYQGLPGTHQRIPDYTQVPGYHQGTIPGTYLGTTVLPQETPGIYTQQGGQGQPIYEGDGKYYSAAVPPAGEKPGYHSAPTGTYEGSQGPATYQKPPGLIQEEIHVGGPPGQRSQGIYTPSGVHVSQQWDGQRPGGIQQYSTYKGTDHEGKITTIEGLDEADDANSQAETSIKRLENGTFASSSSTGVYGGGSAQSQISGTYSGSGSFSAQAQTIEGNRGAQSQIIAGEKGVTSTAQGRGGRGQSQAQMQLGSDMGETIAEAQSSGMHHGTNTQVKASSKGGLADAQASGPGSTSSQAQIGFQPQNEEHETNNGGGPFYGGGTASAQSGKYDGQSQTQIQGRFKYGISYNGAAQAGSGIKDGVARNKTFMKPLNLFGNNVRIDRDALSSTENKNKTEDPPKDVFEESESVMYDNLQLPLNNDASTIQNVGATNNSNSVPKNTLHIEMNQKQTPLVKGDTTDSYDRGIKYNPTVDDYEDSEEDDYDGEFYQNSSPTHQELNQPREVVIQQAGRGQKQHIILGSINKNGIHIVKDSASKDTLKEGMMFQPGEEIPGTQGYTIPIGFRGRVSSISENDDTFPYTDENEPKIGKGQSQQIGLDSANKNGIHIVKDYANKDSLKEGMVFQPGEEIPGTQGYRIPTGFRGRVSSVSQGDETYAYADENGESQAQTITLTPGNGNITYGKPTYKNQHSTKSWHPNSSRYITKVNSNNLKSGQKVENPDSYVTVTKSITGELNQDKTGLIEDKKFSHTYYTKSSTCGYFTFTCNLVYGSQGRTKICKPIAPTNPDGTPINC